MRGLLAVVGALLLSGCGSSWIGLTSEAHEPPRLDAIALEHVPPNTLTLPNEARSIKFAVIGDSGRGSKEQIEVAQRMNEYHQRFDYRFVIMVGDNLYEGPQTPEDYRRKFEEPYQALLDAGVKFYAALGNHDDFNEIYYKPFNMNGHRYYTFTPPADPLTRLNTSVRFFALDSTYITREQLRWFEKESTESKADWKIAFLHHPIYTSGRYGLVARGLRFGLESSFVNGGIDVVFSGHEHIYERLQVQKGILYFISGGAGSLRQGDAAPSPVLARGYDRDYHFMLVEISDKGFFFQAINRAGETVDGGSLREPTGDTAAHP